MAEKLPRVTGFQGEEELANMNRIIDKIDRNKVNTYGDAVADSTGAPDIVAQFNKLLASLRKNKVIK